jgi:uncharacterized protein YecE (DUF72 family)
MSNIYLGCAIWGYRPWVGEWLPAGTGANDMLRAYSQRLTTVEINATFYAVPDAATVARWAGDTPAGFRFCPKVPRAISHGGALARMAGPTRDFIQRMQGLGEKLGPIFLQLPPAYGPDRLADLGAWLESWPEEVELAVEVRHPAWFGGAAGRELNGRLAARGAGRVVVDVRPVNTGATADQVILEARRKKPNVPIELDYTGSTVLLRFMGHPDLAIDQPILAEWAGRISAWLAEGKRAYVFMHCPVEERSPELCYLFAEHMAGLGRPIALPQPEQPPEQLALF